MMARWQFESWQQLFWMNGHGPYVWSAYGLVLIAMLFLVWAPVVRQRQLKKQVRLSIQRENLQQRQ